MNQPLVVDLIQPRSGFFQFFSSWIYVAPTTTSDKPYCAVVDPGPTSSIAHLITTLRSRGIERINHLLLTHIHLDHAGGTGHLVDSFPVDEIVCHAKAIPHLVSPEKLWEGSLATLGEVAIMQGEPAPVPERLLRAPDTATFTQLPVTVHPSPGHAPHHISFLLEGYLFVGEALGVILPDIPAYLRPATPPRFNLEAYLGSIELLSTVKAQQLCFAHFGQRPRTDDIFLTARTQIDRWVAIIGAAAKDSGKEPSEGEFHRLIDQLVAEDPKFLHFQLLEAPLQARERQFVKNSITGIWRYCRGE